MRKFCLDVEKQFEALLAFLFSVALFARKDMNMCVSGVRNVRFSENFAYVLSG